MKTYFVTGAAGFIGSNFVRQLLQEEPNVRIVAYDALTYAGNLENLADCLEHERLQFVRGDICDAQAVRAALADGVDVVVNFAAESHVDRSILGCKDFIRTNIEGTQVLLDESRARGVGLYVQISTDEVYGSLGPTGLFTEQTPLQPRSPYSASKAGADMLVLAYQHTYGMPALITRCSNNYGPYQFPEKLIPLFITNLIEGKKVPVYGDGMNVRDWIHVSDHCRGIRAAIDKGRPGEVYNFGGNNEQNNLAITRLLLDALGKDESSIQFVQDRLGHDRRYAIDATKAQRELGWRPLVDFKDGLAATVRWYRENENWWRRIKTGEYLEYYEKQYGAVC
ncbi:MAG TPA: dTDP-glucose 4,6-dehydratase [Phycisphaerae bacterium]|nr:dTDP-glucose 4,6-dehydratase [Phycisphaerae bacterium]HOJ74578.1 dTDP-glucose 4,6-dehydratase [Phycisphaerae bacterium]HOM50477.1 dTDP-glucose 4,6-dehydratase [Phycisphaerae bacterium]HON69329.1 dTDP-glucose 4,6-dehydratase [Phycisphaerae bacterium]HOQ87582.1 dTDP-glucose 4,6-dehydratase [Phycisphaerae bacterium]